VSGQPRAERHGDETRLARGEEDVEEFHPVAGEDADAAASAGAEAGQQRRTAPRALVERAVREPLARGDHDQRGLAGRQPGPLAEDISGDHGRGP
jgi:hypothetical protein